MGRDLQAGMKGTAILMREGLPDWVPDRIRLYLSHISFGQSLRALARDRGLHASTVLRQVRRCENRRDDPLMDAALTRLAAACRDGNAPEEQRSDQGGQRDMKAETSASAAPKLPPDPGGGLITATELPEAEIRRILRRLAEPGAVLAFAPDMEKAVVLRDAGGGQTSRSAVLSRDLAQALCLRDWITCRKAGRISTYTLTQAGRAALRRMIGGAEQRGGFADAGPVFEQMRSRAAGSESVEDAPSRIRCSFAESPVLVLSRRREKDGQPFLAPELVTAAEQLREDFELGQLDPQTVPDWQAYLTRLAEGALSAPCFAPDGTGRAQERVAAALRDLGPGLGDIALRVCCQLEGIESAERHMGWAARSGKIVLRIALLRLRRHYDETCGRSGPLIG